MDTKVERKSQYIKYLRVHAIVKGTHNQQLACLSKTAASRSPSNHTEGQQAELGLGLDKPSSSLSFYTAAKN
jgi:hypothetical protein